MAGLPLFPLRQSGENTGQAEGGHGGRGRAGGGGSLSQGKAGESPLLDDPGEDPSVLAPEKGIRIFPARDRRERGELEAGLAPSLRCLSAPLPPKLALAHILTFSLVTVPPFWDMACRPSTTEPLPHHAHTTQSLPSKCSEFSVHKQIIIPHEKQHIQEEHTER